MFLLQTLFVIFPSLQESLKVIRNIEYCCSNVNYFVKLLKTCLLFKPMLGYSIRGNKYQTLLHVHWYILPVRLFHLFITCVRLYCHFKVIIVSDPYNVSNVEVLNKCSNVCYTKPALLFSEQNNCSSYKHVLTHSSRRRRISEYSVCVFLAIQQVFFYCNVILRCMYQKIP